MELVTERLILRDFTAEDLPALIAYQSDPRYVAFYGPEEGGAEQTRRLLDMFIRWSAERPRQNYQLAVVEPIASPEPVGCCGVRCEGFEPGLAELGIELAPQRWGRGLATEAARALLAFAFRDLRLRALKALSITENKRVARLLDKLGFRPMVTHAGPDWMRERGFSETEWRLPVDAWTGQSPD